MGMDTRKSIKRNWKFWKQSTKKKVSILQSRYQNELNELRLKSKSLIQSMTQEKKKFSSDLLQHRKRGGDREKKIKQLEAVYTKTVRSEEKANAQIKNYKEIIEKLKEERKKHQIELEMEKKSNLFLSQKNKSETKFLKDQLLMKQTKMNTFLKKETNSARLWNETKQNLEQQAQEAEKTIKSYKKEINDKNKECVNLKQKLQELTFEIKKLKSKKSKQCQCRALLDRVLTRPNPYVCQEKVQLLEL